MFVTSVYVNEMTAPYDIIWSKLSYLLRILITIFDVFFIEEKQLVLMQKQADF